MTGQQSDELKTSNIEICKLNRTVIFPHFIKIFTLLSKITKNLIAAQKLKPIKLKSFYGNEGSSVARIVSAS